jgi:hypothetical protein
MTHIKDGVKSLHERVGPDEKDNAKNRVARSLDLICKFIDEFEGLKSSERGGRASSVPEITIKFSNLIGNEYKPLKGEFSGTVMMTIQEIKKKL